MISVNISHSVWIKMISPNVGYHFYRFAANWYATSFCIMKVHIKRFFFSVSSLSSLNLSLRNIVRVDPFHETFNTKDDNIRFKFKHRKIHP